MSFLWTDKRTNAASASKLWTNIAYIVSTYVVIVNAVGISAELLLVYIATVSGSAVAQRIVDAKYPSTRSPLQSTTKTERE